MNNQPSQPSEEKIKPEEVASQPPVPQANFGNQKAAFGNQAQQQPLPASKVQPVQAEAPTETAVGSIGRVLLIEDDPPMVKMYSTKLQMEGFEVEVAFDGEEGLRKAKEWSPDLVVLDLMIPKVGGMDLLEVLRDDPKTRNLPVIILSNLSQDQDIQKAQQLGAKEFLIKANFTPGQVVEKIKIHIKKSQ